MHLLFVLCSLDFIHGSELDWRRWEASDETVRGSKTSMSISLLDCDSGECTDVCEYEDFKLAPGTADSNNTKCLAVFCSEDFTITVHTCLVEFDPMCTYNHNFKLPFPDCCNKFCQSIVQLHWAGPLNTVVPQGFCNFFFIELLNISQCSEITYWNHRSKTLWKRVKE